jgi:Fe-S-cluster-containing dehydrogenase component
MSRGLRRRELLAGAAAGGALLCVSPRGGLGGFGAARGSRIRWGIAIDVDRCARESGCRRCIDACHAAHQVPALEDPRHEVKWVWKEPFARVFPDQLHGFETENASARPVLVLCNHCQNAACVRVCPTAATWKRSDGVVAMDPHRCIGCRYCMAACPYGARSFNFEDHPARALPRAGAGQPPAAGAVATSRDHYPARAAGVVEKCTLCAERLDQGRLPLCVETCQDAGIGALAFGNLADPASAVRRLIGARQVIRRRPSLGTEPSVFYVVG